MLNAMSQWLLGGPARWVRAGIWSFFAGTGALLCAIAAQFASFPGASDALAERFPQLPTWFVPESPAGYTVATLMVCWGIWAMGAGLQGACNRRSR